MCWHTHLFDHKTAQIINCIEISGQLMRVLAWVENCPCENGVRTLMVLDFLDVRKKV